MRRFAGWLTVALFCTDASALAASNPHSLEARLREEGSAALAAAAEEGGDAKRGAVTFHQAALGCRRCHVAADGTGSVGPDLSKWEERPTTAHLVESLLEPSRHIRRGYESAVVVRTDGRQISGVLVEAGAESVTLRDPQDGALHRIASDEIDEWAQGTRSAMPDGVVGQLGTRQQFLDLVRYLREIADGGPQRADELQPPSFVLAERALPAYESELDHAGLIRALDEDALKQGETIYLRLCANCHGTHDAEGTLPTSRRFARESLRNGSDPYAMYQTLTRGFGMMPAQHWLVPRQKYAVVHYVREAYLRAHNPSQYVPVSEEYLAGLPSGTSLGPAPSEVTPWSAMDYGPSLINTYEIGRDGRNIAYKGIAIRLDAGAGGVSRGRAWAVFEHDTLRLAGFWTGNGFIDWSGIHFDGRHGVHPRVVGTVHVETIGPGWADPRTGSFDDAQRVSGRDGRRYGPLPRGWGRYEGLYHFGGRTVLAYRVGSTPILETPGFLEVGEAPPASVLTRSFEIGPRESDLVLAVATHEGGGDLRDRSAAHVVLGGEAARPAEDPPFSFDGSRYLEVADGAAIDLAGSFTILARIRTTEDGTIVARTLPGEKWVPDGQALFVRSGRLCYDIGWVGVVESDRRVDDGQWHDAAVAFDESRGTATLYVDGKASGSRRLRPRGALEDPVFRIGYCAPDFPQTSEFRGNIAEVEVFGRALDDEELLKPDNADETERDGLLARWTPGDAQGGGRAGGGAEDSLVAVVRRHDASDTGAPPAPVLVAGSQGAEGLTWQRDGDRLCLAIPAGDDPLRFTVWAASTETRESAVTIAEDVAAELPPPLDLRAMTAGGPTAWPQTLETRATIGADDGPFAVDGLTPPTSNPWLARLRLTGLDFFEGGDRAAVCAWDGDVWIVEGLRRDDGSLAWRRVATGLFQPLGLKIVDGRIHVTCRDQLVALHDVNGDGETDFYEAFNSDHQVTEHFHEFAMGLQQDEQGRFYYAKSARHALPAVVPQHGTLLRVTANGASTEILATGFRAANGVCLNPDGTCFVTDQEGHWTPKNRINWVREGGFYGNLLGYHSVTDPSDLAMQPPVCWITNAFDRSPAEPLWVDSRAWEELDGSLLNLSYGYGRIFVVPHERVDLGGTMHMQGGVSPLPLPDFPTGLVRGRFHPVDGQLYACGMFAWAGNQQEDGGLFRVRRTAAPLHVPVAFHARPGELELRFTGEFDRASASESRNFAVTAWSLERSANYGSPHIDEHDLEVRSARLADDGRTIVLEIPELAPTRGLAVQWNCLSRQGTPVSGALHGTIHSLVAAPDNEYPPNHR